jgi:hypothetical protein
MRDVLVPEIILDQPGICASVGERITARVSQHMGIKINISYLELAGFRHSESMAKHQQQQAIVTLPVAGKSLFAAGIEKLLDFIWSQVFSGSFSSGMVHTRFV